MQTAINEEMDLKHNTTELSSETYYAQNKKSYLVIKRLFDIIFSLCALIVLLIPMLVVAVVIRLDSPGPALYKQERLGKNRKPFMMYKFRSMRTDAEKDGPQWAKVNDDRCTKIGRFLRMTHVDELPQLWNVLQGDMSVVGPRPERQWFYEQFETEIPGYWDRLAVKPGLTGVAQINGGYDLTPAKKLVFDMEYIRNASVKLDAKCIWKTGRVLISREGAR